MTTQAKGDGDAASGRTSGQEQVFRCIREPELHSGLMGQCGAWTPGVKGDGRALVRELQERSDAEEARVFIHQAETLPLPSCLTEKLG